MVFAFGVGCEQGQDVDVGTTHQPVVGHDDAEQRPENGAEAAEEVVDDGGGVVQVPRQDRQADDGRGECCATEVQVFWEQVVERIDRCDEIGHHVHGDGQDQQRECCEHQQQRIGDFLDDVGGRLDDASVDSELSAGQSDHDAAEHQHVERDAPEVAFHDRALRRRVAGEVAEVEDERAVDRDPQAGAADDLQPHVDAGQRGRCGPRDGPVGVVEHPDRQRDHRDQNDRTGERLVLADHLHAVADDHHLDHPQRDERDPAERRQPQDAVRVEGLGRWRERDDQDAQHHGSEVGLDAEPGDRDRAADDGRDLRAADAEGDAAHHRERDAGLFAHETRQAE